MESTEEKIRVRAERDLGGVLNVTVEFLRQNAARLMKSLLFIAGPPTLVSTVIIALITTGVGDFDRGVFGRDLGSLLLMVFVAGVAALIGGTVLLCTANGYLKLYMERESEEEIEFSDIWELVKQDFMRMLGTLLGLALIGVVAYFAAAMVAGAVIGVAGTGGGGAGIVVAVVLILAIACGFIYFSVPFVLTIPIRFFEDYGLGASISRAREIVAENWWRTVGLFIVLGIIGFILQTAFQIPYYLFLSLTGESVFEPDQNVVSIVLNALGSLASILVSAMTWLAISFHYFSLVEQKEGTGTLDRIDEIGLGNSNVDNHDAPSF